MATKTSSRCTAAGGSKRRRSAHQAICCEHVAHKNHAPHATHDLSHVGLWPAPRGATCPSAAHVPGVIFAVAVGMCGGGEQGRQMLEEAVKRGQVTVETTAEGVDYYTFPSITRRMPHATRHMPHAALPSLTSGTCHMPRATCHMPRPSPRLMPHAHRASRKDVEGTGKYDEGATRKALKDDELQKLKEIVENQAWDLKAIGVKRNGEPLALKDAPCAATRGFHMQQCVSIRLCSDVRLPCAPCVRMCFHVRRRVAIEDGDAKADITAEVEQELNKIATDLRQACKTGSRVYDAASGCNQGWRTKHGTLIGKLEERLQEADDLVSDIHYLIKWGRPRPIMSSALHLQHARATVSRTTRATLPRTRAPCATCGSMFCSSRSRAGKGASTRMPGRH